MERRQFLGTCAALSGAGGFPALSAWADTAPRFYERARARRRVPARRCACASLKDETNYVFQYPVRRHAVLSSQARPPGRDVGHAQARGRLDVRVARRRRAATMRSSPSRRSARTSSPIRRATSRSSATSGSRSSNSVAQAIHCCAEHSVYDPASGARVVSGPAPQPLAAILLEYDAGQDTLAADRHARRRAVRRVLPQVRIQARDGVRRGQGAPCRSESTTVVKELAQYCRQTIQC